MVFPRFAHRALSADDDRSVLDLLGDWPARRAARDEPERCDDRASLVRKINRDELDAESPALSHRKAMLSRDVMASWVICFALLALLATAGGLAHRALGPAHEPPISQGQARAPLHFSSPEFGAMPG